MSKWLDTYELPTGVTGAWAHEIVAEILHRGKTAPQYATAEPPTAWAAFGATGLDRWFRQRSAGAKAAHLWHRWAPAHAFNPYYKITTPLPGEFPNRALITRDHHFIVPSLAEAHLLQKHSGVELEQCSIVAPAPRMAVRAAPKLEPYPEGGILFLHGKMRRSELERHVRVVSSFFPGWPSRTVDLANRTVFQVQNWTSLLRKTRVCFYLESAPFDPGIAAFEAMTRGVPVVFAEGHRALRRWVHAKDFQMAWYLIERPPIDKLKAELEIQRARWESEATFARSPLETYLKIYETIEARSTPTETSLEAAADTAGETREPALPARPLATLSPGLRPLETLA